MLKVIFYIKSQKTDVAGLAPIFAKISYRNESVTMSTGKSIDPERWKLTNNLRTVLKIEREKVIKEALDSLKLSIEKKFNEILKHEDQFSLKFLKSEIQGKTENVSDRVTIMEVMDIHYEFFKKKVESGERAKASLQKYARAKTLLLNFIRKNSYGDILTENINSAFVFKLEEYLKYESCYKGRKGIQNNSTVKYMRVYKTACIYCIKMGVIDKNPFIVYDGKIKTLEAVFLTQIELTNLEEKLLSNLRLQRVRDIFLFSCYTGYAPIDACKLTNENLFEDGKQNVWVLANRTKTKIKSNVPLLPPALKIIKNYEGMQEGLLPKISNQKMNSYLKELADICNINKKLTWYVARHTFATTIALANGVRIENLSAMMGHTNIKQTQHYAKVLDSSIMLDMERLKEKFSKE